MAVTKRNGVMFIWDELIDAYGKPLIIKATLFGSLCFIGGFLYIIEK